MISLLLMIFSYAIQSFPYSREYVLELVQLAKNSYEKYNLEGLLYELENQSGLKAKVYMRGEKVIVSFRGTTFNVLGSDSSDNFNRIVDNSLFKCCKDQRCIVDTKTAIENYAYISNSIAFVDQVMKLFPTKKIVLTGHSLGGSIASIVGRIKNLEVLAFSSPGERHISDLFAPASASNILHLGACSDTIYTGKCSTQLSPCRIMGYQIETKCRYGRSFCIGTNYPDSILFHRIGFLQYLVENNEDIIEDNNQDCSDCIVERAQTSMLDNILRLLHTT
ncbi:uncharacterized protein VICG_00519 [Vittaforma corneae ATCC 50505]|uniref:triacylglycerol lipase n=1 Tax=Vittaforma corneae (strain ATCC 50505) TaxID=993615 RepID=L2GPI1_VITCO|nr:uncharacterized protein VICG_00519 [Vittaforma corneae ATCC 50505]ELA42420.1 hypothetical protein VICG_00519 [Vittaforma corneae ATCC 50505]